MPNSSQRLDLTPSRQVWSLNTSWQQDMTYWLHAIVCYSSLQKIDQNLTSVKSEKRLWNWAVHPIFWSKNSHLTARWFILTRPSRSFGICLGCWANRLAALPNGSLGNPKERGMKSSRNVLEMIGISWIILVWLIFLLVYMGIYWIILMNLMLSLQVARSPCRCCTWVRKIYTSNSAIAEFRLQ